MVTMLATVTEDRIIPPLNKKEIDFMEVPVLVVFAFNDRGFPMYPVRVVVKVVKTTFDRFRDVIEENVHLTNDHNNLNNCYAEVYLAPNSSIIPHLVHEK